MSPVDVVAVLLFLVPVPGWVATVILLAAALRRPRIASLTERAFAAVLLSGAASLVAFLASARLAGHPIDNGLAAALLIVVCFAVSVPQIVWLIQFLGGAFGRGSDS